MDYIPTRSIDECIQLARRQRGGEDLGFSDAFVATWADWTVASVNEALPSNVVPIDTAPAAPPKPAVQAAPAVRAAPAPVAAPAPELAAAPKATPAPAARAAV